MAAAGVFDDVALPVAVDPCADPDLAAAVLASTDAHRASLAALAWTDATGLSAAGRVDRLAAVRRHIAMLQAWQTEALAEFAAEREADEFAAMEVAPALSVSQRSASARMTDAAYVSRVLAETLVLQARGDITEAHTRSLAEAVRALPDEVAGAVQARVLRRAAGQSLPAFRVAVRKAVAELDARDQEAKHAAARDERRVTRSPAPDGMGELWAWLPGEDCEKVYRAIEHTASALFPPADPRSADQRRADALVAIADAVLAGRMSDVGSATADAAPVVLIPASTLFGGDAPAELAGHGPISASHARAIAVAAARWRIAVTDDEGRLLVRSANTYRVPRALKEHVRLRDRRCTFPHCTARAAVCDTDHLDAWPHGATHQHNLHALCRRHHRLKHRARGWSIRRDPTTGRITWTSPTGHLYPEEPPELPG